MWTYFVDVRDLVDTAGLADLDPYGDKVWHPDEVGPVADRLQALYEAVAAAGGSVTSLLEPTLVPPRAVGGGTVLDFIYWLRKVFMEAGHRRMYMYAIGD